MHNDVFFLFFFMATFIVLVVHQKNRRHVYIGGFVDTQPTVTLTAMNAEARMHQVMESLRNIHTTN